MRKKKEGGTKIVRQTRIKIRCRGIAVRRVLSLFLVLVLLGTTVTAGQETAVYGAASTPVSKHGRLSVKDADLVDGSRNKFQLRGISTHGINWDVGYPYVNKAAFKTLRDDWGVNAVRLAMYTSEYNGYCSGGSTSDLRNRIYKGVKYATEKYSKQKNVIYEICNEPNGCSWSTIRSYAAQVIKIIRKYEKNAVIIVGTSLLSSRTRKTSQWKTSELSKAGQYIRSKYRARKKALGSKA